MLVTIILSLISVSAQASETTWLCSEMNSLRRGSSILACGTASNTNRSEAEKAAFFKALKEFNRVCGVSDDCANHRVSADPKRTVCSQSKGFYTCTRLVEFVIGSIQVVDGKPLPTPSSVKIQKGLTKQQILKVMGTPSSVSHDDSHHSTQWVYLDNKNCLFDSMCWVMFEKGILIKHMNFKVELTDDLL